MRGAHTGPGCLQSALINMMEKPVRTELYNEEELSGYFPVPGLLKVLISTGCNANVFIT